jgi:hypothetical protein
MPDYGEETVKVVVTMALSVPLHHSAPCIQFIMMQMYPLYIFLDTTLSSVKGFDDFYLQNVRSTLKD